MAKTVQPIAIELGIKGGEKLAALNRSFRDLSKQVKLSDVDIIQATKDVAKFAQEAGNSEATIKGQIKAFEGLREQAAMGGKAYTALRQEISNLKSTLRGSSAADLIADLASGAAVKNQKNLREAISQLQAEMSELNTETTEGSAKYAENARQVNNLQKELDQIANSYRNVADMTRQATASQVDYGAVARKMYLERDQPGYKTPAEIRGRQFLERIDAEGQVLRQTLALPAAGQTSAPGTGAAISGGAVPLRGTRGPLRPIAELPTDLGTIGGRRQRPAGVEAEINDQARRSYISQTEAVRKNNEAKEQAIKIEQGYKAEIDKAVKANNQSINSTTRLRSALDAYRSTLPTTSKEFRNLTDQINKLDKQSEKTSRRMRGRRMSAGKLAQAAGATISGGIFGGPEGFLGGAIGTALGGPGGAFAGAAIGAQVGGLRQQLGGFADYAAQISKLEIALKGVAGSVEQYDQALKAARRSVEELNVPQDVAIQGMTRLVAAVKGAGGGVNDAEIAFQNINSAIIATGGGAEEVSGAITALVQIFSKGKVSAEEINQIAERLPGTFNKIAAASGRTGPELTKALEQGQVGLNDLMKFLVQLGDDYGSVARDIANSSVSAGDRLNRAFDDMRRGVGDALQPIGAEFQNTFARFAEEIAPKVIEAAKNIANALKPVIENLDLLLVLVSSLAAGAAIGAVIKGILALKVGIIAVTGAFLGAKTAIAGLTAVMALNPLFAGALAVGGIVTGIYAITKALKGQREELQKLAAVNSGQFINNLSASERATKISATKSLLAEQGRIIREENEKLGQTEDKRAKRAIVERLSAAKKEEERLSRNLKRLTAPVTEKDLKVSQFDNLISKDDKTGKAAEKEANRIAALQRAIAEFESRRKLLDIEAKITEARQAQVLAQSRGDVPLSDFIDDKLVALELEKAAAEESARYEAKEREIRETMSGQVADLSNQLNIMESIRAKQEAEARASAQTLDNEIRKTVELEAQNRLIAQSLVDRKFELGFITKSEYNQFLLNRERERINKEFSRAAPEERDQLLDLYRQQIDPTFAEGLAQNIRNIKAELEELINPINQVTSAANAIGTAFTDSFTSVISGSATTQEALANFFGNIGKYFLDMAAQIIQKMITMAILNQVVGLLPGLGSSASGFNLNGFKFQNLASDAGSGVSGFLAGASGILGKANGGPVNANQPYIVGERGPELFVPFQQGSITSNEALQQAATTQVPFTRNAESVTQAQETAQAMRAAGPIEVRYESNVINGVEYVTAEQHRKGMAQAAERGRSLTIQALQNSVKTRGRVGL